MKKRLIFMGGLSMLIASCGPAPETVKPPVKVAETKEMVYKRGHQLFLEQRFDSATIELERAISLDGKYVAPLVDLGEMYYLIGMRDGGDKQPKFVPEFQRSQRYFAEAEALGSTESLVLERLCELANIMEDDAAFVRYAKKTVAAYPYDRQYFNLGYAYIKAGEYLNAIACQKEAAQKFEQSPYIGSFYRQLGRAYMKVDRDQTAERIFATGLSKIDEVVTGLKKVDSNSKASDAYRRLMDDKIGILTSLKSLHQTYKAMDKLERVEKELKEANEKR